MKETIQIEGVRSVGLGLSDPKPTLPDLAGLTLSYDPSTKILVIDIEGADANVATAISALESFYAPGLIAKILNLFN